ncbi:unnamed protein product [Kuraishia capsulata CBS 1993]|uniref:UBX domain-containing protein n=1 Tax=Kuraishia capsulata CBS 1993 TaxID=1382522 RepID=W6MN14_9ASCO|nr:uncharacterized protein KUCA_T00002384001 [Kuraishia capsulata CBS 1993]CDK26412.1 unnamed protein product [Kuraishia capsulata CBS 1993]
MSLISVNYGARSLKVKTSPGMLLNEILVRSCNHFKLASDKWALKHGQSNIDLSLPVRLSGLSAGAKLELVEKPADGANNSAPSKITLKLQILDSTIVVPADASLLIGQFETGESVLNILRYFEGRTGLSLVERTTTETDVARRVSVTRGYRPVVQSFTRTLSTDSELLKPVSDLGFSSGNVVLRLKFEKVLEEEVGLETAESVPAPEEVLQNNEPIPADDTKMDVDGDTVLKETSPSAQSEKHSTRTDVTPEKDLSEVTVFIPDEVPIKAAATDDSTYDMSISQAKKYQAMLQKKAGSGPMLSQRMRQQAAASAKAVEICQIRVRFPDWTSIQFSLEPTKTLGDLYSSLLEFLVEQKGGTSDGMFFHLATTHPHRILNKTKDDFTKRLVSDLEFGHRTVLVFEDIERVSGKRYLKDQYLSEARPISEAAEVQLDHHRSDLEDAEHEILEEATTVRPTAASQTRSSSKVDGKKIPKWLKFK